MLHIPIANRGKVKEMTFFWEEMMERKSIGGCRKQVSKLCIIIGDKTEEQRAQRED